jgi:hypothetical protein
MLRLPVMVFGVALALAAVPAVAAQSINSLGFLGKGVITYSNDVNSPPIGTAVTVSGTIQFAFLQDIGTEDEACYSGLPARFTGTLTMDVTNFCGSYYYMLSPGQFAGSHDNAPYAGGTVSLVNGRITSLSFYNDNGSNIVDLSRNRFSRAGGWLTGTDYEWGGKWALVPEPQSWALMIGGFGLVGCALRRRRSTASHAA